MTTKKGATKRHDAYAAGIGLDPERLWVGDTEAAAVDRAVSETLEDWIHGCGDGSLPDELPAEVEIEVYQDVLWCTGRPPDGDDCYCGGVHDCWGGTSYLMVTYRDNYTVRRVVTEPGECDAP